MTETARTETARTETARTEPARTEPRKASLRWRVLLVLALAAIVPTIIVGGLAIVRARDDVQREVIEITANAQKADDPFNGKYYIMGLTHRHTMPKIKDGGFVTILKLARDAQGGGG